MFAATRAHVLLRALPCLLLAGALLGTASAARAQHATTAPGSLVDIRVIITERGLEMNHDASAPRGATATFLLRNDTGSTVRFVLLGAKSKPLAPHESGRFQLFLPRRGAYDAKVELSPRHTLNTTFVVY
jgi:hypothetical protein